MKFDLQKSIIFLQNTPKTLSELLKNIDSDWIHQNEGPETWSPYQVVGHLIHGEKTDWIPRVEIILSSNPDKRFTPFDRFAQMNSGTEKSLDKLLSEFSSLREKSLQTLKSKSLTEKELGKTGIHPEFGEVTLRQLLSTWVAHDLGHVAQISRVLAKQLKEEIGPWYKYLKIVQF